MFPFIWKLQRETRLVNPPKEDEQIGLEILTASQIVAFKVRTTATPSWILYSASGQGIGNSRFAI
jgi:hypothetical protein